MSDHPTLTWTDPTGLSQTARWRSESGVPAPRRVVVADDQMPADRAYRLVCEGTALLWQGDFHNARQLLQALTGRFHALTGMVHHLRGVIAFLSGQADQQLILADGHSNILTRCSPMHRDEIRQHAA